MCASLMQTNAVDMEENEEFDAADYDDAETTGEAMAFVQRRSDVVSSNGQQQAADSALDGTTRKKNRAQQAKDKHDQRVTPSPKPRATKALDGTLDGNDGQLDSALKKKQKKR